MKALGLFPALVCARSFSTPVRRRASYFERGAPVKCAARGAQVDCIIGYNFLNEFKITIDYPNETLRFD
jgi:hypothetical protein